MKTSFLVIFIGLFSLPSVAQGLDLQDELAGGWRTTVTRLQPSVADKKEALKASATYALLKPKGHYNFKMSVAIPNIYNKRKNRIYFPSRRHGNADFPLRSRARFQFRVWAHQTGKRPMVVIIPGMGADIDDDAAKFFAEKIFNDGYHVLLVPNNLTWQFAVQASSSGLPGITTFDALDMIRAISLATQKVKKSLEIGISELNITGYSLGALLAAYVAKTNEDVGYTLPINKTILINPPVDIQASIARMDDWCFAGRTEDVWRHANSAVKSFEIIVKHHKTVNLKQSNVEAFWKNLEQRKVDLKKVFGCGFFLGINKVVYVSQQINDLKILHKSYKPKYPVHNRKFGAYTKEVTLSDYLYNFMRVYYVKISGHNFADLIYDNDLQNLRRFFKFNSKVFLISSADDIINDPETMLNLAQEFGDRAIVFRKGGHMGNLWGKEGHFLIRDILEK